ncbi:MAG TPA: arginase [Rhabdochlamydiaceae bacterium]|nr:arginase [Rhabdochlamydiaceae bacterium]
MIRLIGAASGWGAQLRGCAEGPQYLQKIFSFLPWRFVFPKQKVKSSVLSLIHEFNLMLAVQVESCIQQQIFPVVIGGDHSIAVGTWNGVYSAGQQAPLGLIWIDSHMDSHTPETTPSNAIHGMPLAGLLGFGPPSLSALKGNCPVLLPENLCLIGVRSFEEEEAALLQKLGVRIFFMDEVKQKGLDPIFEEALQRVTKNTKHYGISLDLDVIDPKEAPGVGSPEENGIAKKQLLEALPKICYQPQLTAFELVEYNPHHDVDNKTAHICSEILSIILQRTEVYHG